MVPLRPASGPRTLNDSRFGASSCSQAPQQRQQNSLSQAAHRRREISCNSQTASGTTQADELLGLREENLALRRELAKYQEVAPEQVRFERLADSKAPAADPPEAAVEIHEADVPSEPYTLRNLENGINWPSPEEYAAWERPARSRPWKGSPKRSRTAKDPNPLHIVHMSAEFAPVAKVGGLADVVTGLARASLERGHNVEVVLPFYQFLDEAGIKNLQHVADFDVPKGKNFDGHMQMGSLRTSAFSGTIDGIPMLLLRPDWGATNIFQGSGVYAGSYNETEAYLYFSRASLELLRVTNRRPHIIHAHEWQTAAVPMLFWERYYQEGLDSARVVFTIHNLDSQGECRQEEFAVTGVPGEIFADVNKALDERTIGHNPERLCLMKGGIVYANVITTVSPTYASEAVDGGAAGWLKSTFARPDVRAKFKGILNGIDTGLWDPMADSVLPAPFDHDRLEGKALCKKYLQKALHMGEADRKPIVAVISRLVPQKGIHLIKHAVYRTLERGGQFVLLGSGHADGDFRAMADGEFRGHPDVRLMIMYSDSLAHLLYAAADIVLVPSLFEPCGLTQLVGMRYGAVPVVRSTGGLADTVKDVSQGEDANGFTFEGLDNSSLNFALDRALEAYQTDAEWWQQFVVRNMLRDSSWQTSTGEYVKLYSQLQPW